MELARLLKDARAEVSDSPSKDGRGRGATTRKCRSYVPVLRNTTRLPRLAFLRFPLSMPWTPLSAVRPAFSNSPPCAALNQLVSARQRRPCPYRCPSLGTCPSPPNVGPGLCCRTRGCGVQGDVGLWAAFGVPFATQMGAVRWWSEPPPGETRNSSASTSVGAGQVVVHSGVDALPRWRCYFDRAS